MRTAKAIVGLAAAILLTTAAPAGADILPVGVWSFNEGKGTIARDSSGIATKVIFEGLAQWAPGRFQGAVKLQRQRLGG